MIRLILLLAINISYAGMPCDDPNEECLQRLVCNWLRENPIVDRQIYVQDQSEPNAYFKYTIKTWRWYPLWIMDLNFDGKTTLEDFSILSSCWIPSKIIPAPPIQEPNIIEPNDAALGSICYTVGGKHHLYEDCRYIKDKAWTPCLCDANEICLTCLSRKVKEQ